MLGAKEKLMNLIKERSLSLDGPFTLASGDISNYCI